MSDPTRAVAAIYERYHQSLYRFCFSIVGNAEDAQDALQNAMLKAIRALPGEQREIQLKPWLYRIAHNESIEILRKRREEAQIDPELVASSAGPEETAATRERLRRLLADLSELPERQRGALVMRELGGLGFSEIGEALGASEAVARQTVYEARLGLHQLEAGREMSCESVMRQISDADGRTMRRRDIRAHLRACPECRQFRDAIEDRSRDLAAIAPLPAAASLGILHALLGAAGGHATAGAGAASTLGVGAGKAVATSAVLKSAATVAVVAALGVGAADRGGVVDVGLPGGSHGGEAASSETTGTVGGDVEGEGTSTAASAQSGGGAAGHGAGKQALAGAAATGKRQGGAEGGNDGPTGTGGPEAAADHGQGPPTGAGLPPASQHGQETAAGHKATPETGSASGHGTGGGNHASHSGRGHSHSHGAAHSHRGSHPHRGSSHHSGGGGAQGGSQSQPPPPRLEPAEAQSPTATPEARTGTESTEGLP
jgi:RNA polymerase sigma factor (sigma-70 family)